MQTIKLKSLITESSNEVYYVIDTSDNDILFVGTMKELRDNMSVIVTNRNDKWYRIFKNKKITLDDLIKNKSGVRGIKLIKAKDYSGYKGYTYDTFDPDEV